MLMIRATGVMLVLLAFVAVSEEDAEGGGEAQKKKKNKGGIKGAIVSVTAGKEANEGTITIKTAATKKAPAAAAKEMKITISKDTRIEKSVGKKKDKMPAVAGVFGDLAAGKQVVVTLRTGSTDEAAKVTVGAAKKKKN